MEVKEAIKFDYINFLKSFKELVTREFCNPPGIRDVNKRIDEIIALLQRGKIDKEELKKVWQMWDRLEHGVVYDDEGNYTYSWSDKLIGHMHRIKRDVEQKYFPKEAKRGSYFYECTSEEIYHLKKIPLKKAKK